MKPICLVLLALSFSSLSAQEITEENWLTHPRIKDIRLIFGEIEEGISSGRYQHHAYSYEYDEPYMDTQRDYYLDPNGTIRKCMRFGGSGDSAIGRYYFYDEKGNLVFFFAKAGAVNETTVEHRIYFEGGKRIWEKKKKLTGPGWGFPNPWPTHDIIYSPAELWEEDKAKQTEEKN